MSDFSQRMNIMVPDQPPTHGAQHHERSRIETQIHRRKKAKAFSALEPEWDHNDHVSPSHLRMPSGRMSPIPSDKTRAPHKEATPAGQSEVPE
jgi:hypothetical protein